MVILRTIKAKIKSTTAVPHFTLVSVLIGVGVSVATLLVIATIDGGLFGQEAEASARRNGRINRG